MALYLSSDERTLDKSNTRTKFKNTILPDFFVNDSFNLKLHEIFFDSKFPTLANYDYPHIITTVIRNEHKLQDFPENFQNNSMFKYLFKNDANKEYSPLMRLVYYEYCNCFAEKVRLVSVFIWTCL